MLFVIEIMLTVSAWKKGWKAFALVPVAVAFLVAILAGSSATSMRDLRSTALALDVLLIACLAFMSSRGPEAASAPAGIIDKTEASPDSSQTAS